jgi:Tat protein translocase TatB subunit
MIIAVIALIVLGPEKFPEYAKIAMRAYRDFRGYIDDIKREMTEELKPVKEELRELARHNPEEYVEDLAKAISAIGDEKKPTVASSETETKEASPAPPYPESETPSEPTAETAPPPENETPPEPSAETAPPPESETPSEPTTETAPPTDHIETPDRLDG